MTNFGDYQDEIYLAGLSGRTPRFPFRFEELEARAHAAMSPSLASYVAGGSGDERTQEANVVAFDKWGLTLTSFPCSETHRSCSAAKSIRIASSPATRTASASSTAPQLPPIAQAPKPISPTLRPVRPKTRDCITASPTARWPWRI